MSAEDVNRSGGGPVPPSGEDQRAVPPPAGPVPPDTSGPVGAPGHPVGPVPPGPTPASGPGAPRRSRRKVLLWGLLGLVLVVGCFGVTVPLGVAFFAGVKEGIEEDITFAEVGDCVRQDTSDSTDPYSLVDCADDNARYRVLKIMSDDTCNGVPGMTDVVTYGSDTFCLGPADVPEGMRIDQAREGDCVSLPASHERRIDCADPKAEYKVVKRLTNVPTADLRAGLVCQGVPGVEQIYEWSWTYDSPTPTTRADLVLCVGAK